MSLTFRKRGPRLSRISYIPLCTVVLKTHVSSVLVVLVQGIKLIVTRSDMGKAALFEVGISAVHVPLVRPSLEAASSVIASFVNRTLRPTQRGELLHILLVEFRCCDQRFCAERL